MLYILTRKAGIATCGLVFRTNPGFMLAGVLLILFISYMVQVKHQPYMSTSQRALVIAEHKIKVASGDPLHMGINLSIQKAMTGEGNANDYQRARRAKIQFQNSQIGIGHNAHNFRKISSKKSMKSMSAKESKRMNSSLKKAKDSKKQAKNKAKEFFFDYNTVEQVLLACAILVCLAGVMFESDRFQSVNASGKLRYGWMRDVVTYSIISVVIASLLYLVIVFMSEVLGYTPPCLQRLFADKKNHALLSAAETIQDQEDNQIEMQIVNPAASAAQVADAQQLKDLQEKLTHQEQVNDSLAAARLKQNRDMSKNSKINLKKNKKKGRGKGKGKGKKDFGAKRTSFGAKEDGSLFQMKSDESSKDQQTSPVKTGRRSNVRRTNTGSEIHVDGTSGKEYKHNEVTGNTEWLVSGVNTQNPLSIQGPNKIDDSELDLTSIPQRTWSLVSDQSSGKEYYHNVVDNSVTWSKPDDSTIITAEDPN